MSEMTSRSRSIPAKGKSLAMRDIKPKMKGKSASEGGSLQRSTDGEYRRGGPTRKRKTNDDGTASKLMDSSKKLKVGDIPHEKRLKSFRKKAPQSYLARLDRVLTQRMFLLDRERKMSSDGTYEEEIFDIVGTTGNVYQVTISKLPWCTCPDNQKGNQCKHIIYILVNVLKAPNSLSYQLAFLSSELTTLFANAPTTPQSSSNFPLSVADGLVSSASKRKEVEGDCPICMMELSLANEPIDEIIFCRAACGNNIHRQCFNQWAASKMGQGPVRCVYCRSVWQDDEKSLENVKRISRTGAEVGEDGYVNVAHEVGLSGERDWSTYHQPWVDQQQWGRYGMGRLH